MEPGWAIGSDIAKGEAVEAEIDVLISRRDAERRKSEGEWAAEDLWRASECRQEALRREEEDWGRLVDMQAPGGRVRAALGGVPAPGRRH